MTDFGKLAAQLEECKKDRSTIPLSDHLQAVGEFLPAFAAGLLPAEISPSDHIKTCSESATYYTTRIMQTARSS